MDPVDRRPLIDLPRRLLAAYGRPVPYSTVWRLAVQGSIPVERVGRNWFFDPDDLDRIARAVGLPAPPAAAA